MRRVFLLGSIVVALVGLADGLAMLFPGPSSGVTGLFLTGASLGWLLLALPWLCRPAYRPYYGVVVSAFGVLVLPVLFFPVAIAWFVTSPSALSAWFVCAWVVVWSACFAILAFVKCPSCQQSYFRHRLRIRISTTGCAHCGVSPGPVAV